MTDTDVAFLLYCRSCSCDRHDLYLRMSHENLGNKNVYILNFGKVSITNQTKPAQSTREGGLISLGLASQETVTQVSPEPRCRLGLPIRVGVDQA